ncbi:MAG TPA: LysR family transcriptional regulator [Umezawaea sp.]|nr:LysR family transcriptional regulator [Umezawaea sp.]
MNLDAVRTFVAAADAGRFQDAADDLSITQQAVSKRVAALEKELGVRLFTRTARGARLTVDGRAFLPHARLLVQVAERAVESVRRGRRALRVDVIGRRLAPADLLRDFHRAHPEVELDVVTLPDGDAATTAVRSGAVDASFRAVTAVPDGVRAVWVLDEPVQLLVGPGHPFGGVRSVAPGALLGRRVWMPGIAGEWAAYYGELAEAFGFTIDAVGPNFGTEPLLDVIAGSAEVMTFVGAQTRLFWPGDFDLRRVALHDPTPVYPHSLLWHDDNTHPGLEVLRDYLGSVRSRVEGGTWAPTWAQRPGPRVDAGTTAR